MAENRAYSSCLPSQAVALSPQPFGRLNPNIVQHRETNTVEGRNTTQKTEGELGTAAHASEPSSLEAETRALL